MTRIQVASSGEPNTTPLTAAEGVPLTFYSHSYGNVQEGAAKNVSTVQSLYISRIERRLRLGSLLRASFNGYYMKDVAFEAINGGNGAEVEQEPESTKHKFIPIWKVEKEPRGLVIIDATQNDMMKFVLAIGRLGYRQALKALLCLLLANEEILWSNVAFKYTGEWAEGGGADERFRGAKFKTTAKKGAFYEVEAIASAFALLMIGSSGTERGIAKVSVDGVEQGEYPLGEQCPEEVTSGKVAFNKSVPIAIPIWGKTNTLHKIKVENVGAEGTKMEASALLKMGASILPPTILVMQQQILETYAAEGSDAAVKGFNETIKEVVAEFNAAGFTNIIAMDASAGWNKATMLKERHPNDLGMSTIATNVISTISALPYRYGLNVY